MRSARPDIVSIDSDARSIEADAPVGDAQDPMRCRIEPADVFLLGNDGDVETPERIVDVIGSEREFVVLWRERIGAFPQIRAARIGSSADAPAATTLTSGDAIHDEPSVAPVADGYIVAEPENSTGDFEIYAALLEPSGLGDVQPLTSLAGRDDFPVLVGTAAELLAAWVESRGTEASRVEVVRKLDSRAMPSGPTTEPITSTGLGRIVGGAREGGAVLVYTNGGSTPGVRLQPIAASGTADGASAAVSTEGSATSDVVVGMAPCDGAVVFMTVLEGARRDVRVCLLDRRGVPARSEFALNEGRKMGDSASVVRLRESAGWSEGCRDGYAVVDRSHPGDGREVVLRLVLLYAGVRVVRALDLSSISDLSARGGRVTLRIAGDGRLLASGGLIGWADARSDRVDIRAARIRCDGARARRRRAPTQPFLTLPPLGPRGTSRRCENGSVGSRSPRRSRCGAAVEAPRASLSKARGTAPAAKSLVKPRDSTWRVSSEPSPPSITARRAHGSCSAYDPRRHPSTA